MDSHIQKKYEVEKRLGKGAYGIVWKATSKRWVTPGLVEEYPSSFFRGFPNRTFRW